MTHARTPGRAPATVALAVVLAGAVPLPAGADDRDRRTCIASWYGAPQEMLDGWPTASGEPFDPEAMTAASRDLPFGTRVRVTNAGTGDQVMVRINDRGPRDTSRCIDLSRAAFEEIADTGQGLVRVSLETLGGVA
ncbi:septal ring lytic transglycosylase RlpA family protein [Streptomyces rectiverticillatus]|uniref:septal ring lytic transglycosylase RlpA family protein n=1 Tax=Streptomyces rectiverticillatus TaxID=173860 RepID=UPI001C4AE2B3|nr:septal ring lytic transglycosylase RlpA family protein [Streptomyces rectiverticillatus]